MIDGDLLAADGQLPGHQYLPVTQLGLAALDADALPDANVGLFQSVHGPQVGHDALVVIGLHEGDLVLYIGPAHLNVLFADDLALYLLLALQAELCARGLSAL